MIVDAFLGEGVAEGVVELGALGHADEVVGVTVEDRVQAAPFYA